MSDEAVHYTGARDRRVPDDELPAPGVMGELYICCFRDPQTGQHVKIADHAGHYVGWTLSLPRREYAHRQGWGSKLMKEVKRQGYTFLFIPLGEGTRDDERKLKKRKASPRLICPECRAETQDQRDRDRHRELTDLDYLPF